jgi:hypothetical protein
VFGGCVARVAYDGRACVACGLFSVPIGQVVYDACDVYGGCVACVERGTCVVHVAVAVSKGELA